MKSTGDAFGLALADGLGLAAGETVFFHEIAGVSGEVREVAAGTVNAGGTAIDVVSSGEGLRQLTWLLVTW